MTQASMDNNLAQEVRLRDYDRFLAIQLAPPLARPALYAVTAFSLELARIAGQVSEPMLGAVRLAWWREGVEEIIIGAAVRPHPVLQALVPLYAQWPQLFTELLAMIEARAMDLEPDPWPDHDAWLAYLDATAGALHRAWGMVLIGAVPAEMSSAINVTARGVAISGLLRSIPHMAAQGWCGFSQSLLHAAGMEELRAGAALTAWVTGQRMAAERMLEQAQSMRNVPALYGLAAFARRHLSGLQKAWDDPYTIRPLRLSLVVTALRIKYF